MVDPPHQPEIGGHEPDPGRSRLLRLLGITVAIALVVLVVVLHLTGTLGPGGH